MKKLFELRELKNKKASAVNEAIEAIELFMSEESQTIDVESFMPLIEVLGGDKHLAWRYSKFEHREGGFINAYLSMLCFRASI